MYRCNFFLCKECLHQDVLCQTSSSLTAATSAASQVAGAVDPPVPPSPPCRRYYGRRGQDSRSESGTESEPEDKGVSNMNTVQNQSSTNNKINNM